jgi:uncharacterized membrane protein
MPIALLSAMILASALGSGLVAGTFFAFSTFVMAAFARLPPPQGIAAMQSINIAVISPWFMMVFLGMVLLSVGLVVSAYWRWSKEGTGFLLAGAVLYLLSFEITIAFNVPLNDALAAVDPASAQAATMWTDYVSRWTTWNTLLADLSAGPSSVSPVRPPTESNS